MVKKYSLAFIVLLTIVFFGFLIQYLAKASGDSPNSLRSYAELAEMAVREGDFDSANILCNQILTDFSDDPALDEAINLVTLAYWQKAEYAKVSELSSAVISSQPDNARWAHNRNACAAYKLGDFDQAYASCQTMLSDYIHYPSSIWAVNEVAYYCQEEGNNAKARQLYEGLIQNAPSGIRNLLRSYAELAKMDVQDGDFDSADIRCNKILSDFSDDPLLDKNLNFVCLAYWDKAEYAKIKELASAVIDSQPNAAMRAHNYMSRAAFKLGDYASADASCQKLLSDYSQDKSAIWSVNEVAYYYQNKGDDAKARQLYEGLIQNAAGGSVNLLRTYAELTKMDVQDGNFDSADIRCNQILTDFSDDPLLDENVDRINRAYWRNGDYAKARELALEVINMQPENALRAYAQLARMDVVEEGFDSADVHCDQILTDFSENPALDKEFKRVIWTYWEKGDYAKVRELALAVISSQPDNAMWARSGLIRTDIALGNDSNITEQLDELIGEFASNPFLPDAILETGLAYYTKARYRALEGDNESEKAFYRDAISIYEKVISEFGGSDFTGSAYFRAGILYAQEFGEYQTGIDYFQAAVDSRPVYGFAWAAQYLVGKYYEKLRDNGAIERLEANTMIKEAYQAVVENWPDCDWADGAQLKLDRIAFEEANQ